MYVGPYNSISWVTFAGFASIILKFTSKLWVIFSYAPFTLSHWLVCQHLIKTHFHVKKCFSVIFKLKAFVLIQTNEILN